MRHRGIVAAMAFLGLALAGGLVTVVRQGRGAERVYTVAQVTAGLAHHPAAWAGRTLEVRGRAVISLCPGAGSASCPSAVAVLVDLHEPSSRLRLTWTKVNPLLTVLLRVPYVGRVAVKWVGGVGVYRVRLIRVTLVEPPGDLPNYFPYTSRAVLAYDDQALLVNGLN